MTRNDEAALVMLRAYMDLIREREKIMKARNAALQKGGQAYLENFKQQDDVTAQMRQTWGLLETWRKGESILLARLAAE